MQNPSLSVIEGTLASAVADAGTFTVSYPSGKDESNFYNAMEHVFILDGQNTYNYPDDFDITLGTSNITVTNKTGATWAASSTFRLQLSEIGRRSNYSGPNLLANAWDADFVVVQICPDTADADGVCASQSGTADTAMTIAGALASGGVATFDTPRNVVAAWTGTAVLTITGTDAYGNTIVETSASGTSHIGKKAFKTVTSVVPSANITSATVGSGEVVGLPVFLPSEANVLSVAADGVPLPRRVEIPFEIESTELLAGTSTFVVAPYAGMVERMTTVVQAAVTTGGAVTLEIETVAVAGLSVTVADASAAGDIDTDVPTTVDGSDSTTFVAARGDLEVVPASAFATAGALNGTIDLNTWGVITAGMKTGGGSTGTTADVRGTFRPPANFDGSTVYTMVLALPRNEYRGTSQYTG